MEDGNLRPLVLFSPEPDIFRFILITKTRSLHIKEAETQKCWIILHLTWFTYMRMNEQGCVCVYKCGRYSSSCSTILAFPWWWRSVPVLFGHKMRKTRPWPCIYQWSTSTPSRTVSVCMFLCVLLLHTLLSNCFLCIYIYICACVCVLNLINVYSACQNKINNIPTLQEPF